VLVDGVDGAMIRIASIVVTIAASREEEDEEVGKADKK
jgi:hypothetical protein